MPISSWAAMTKRHLGRQWHCRTIRTINLDYASPPQAMQWPDDRSKHTGQWLDCSNSIPRDVFPLSKTGALGAPKTACDMKKDCGKPGCPNEHHGQVVALLRRVDRRSATSANGTVVCGPRGCVRTRPVYRRGVYVVRRPYVRRGYGY